MLAAAPRRRDRQDNPTCMVCTCTPTPLSLATRRTVKRRMPHTRDPEHNGREGSDPPRTNASKTEPPLTALASPVRVDRAWAAKKRQRQSDTRATQLRHPVDFAPPGPATDYGIRRPGIAGERLAPTPLFNDVMRRSLNWDVFGRLESRTSDLSLPRDAPKPPSRPPHPRGNRTRGALGGKPARLPP